MSQTDCGLPLNAKRALNVQSAVGKEIWLGILSMEHKCDDDLLIP